ncbi:hypothetical protein [Pelagibacterium halotolerans]|uniref:hypothetical protein n=1 Tax=Pelagibacterium halotolerans TaxID=531813 RepID=UPI00059F493F|nr:hypothetical protein [Pelagibacterium halotolerans]QJR20207.1 hypothetical protein HKM20_18250 [Pelagibacterium halotolerans]
MMMAHLHVMAEAQQHQGVGTHCSAWLSFDDGNVPRATGKNLHDLFQFSVQNLHTQFQFLPTDARSVDRTCLTLAVSGSGPHGRGDMMGV